MSRYATSAALAALLVAGCANHDMGDLRRYVAEVKARNPGQIAPLPEIRQVETFVYVPGDRRDPFSLGGKTMEENPEHPSNGIHPDPLRRKEELEQYPLDSIRMVGTLEQNGETWGLVRVKDGTLFRVKAGNYMGQNHGQITRISQDKIDLTEIVPDGGGGWRERQASVALSE
jgi:type IV pilus assembly protein PilP